MNQPVIWTVRREGRSSICSRRPTGTAKQTLILITHDENIALQADRILTISDGRILRDEVMRV